MEKEKSCSANNLNIYWTKSDKEPRRKLKPSIPTQETIKKQNLNYQSQQLSTPTTNTISSNNNTSTSITKITPRTNTTVQSSSDSSQKVTFKDLCDEDKARIANLIKTLAKTDAEKEEISKCLEDERTNYNKKLKGILKQQEILITEKQLLLTKFAETEEKLEQISEKKRIKTPTMNHHRKTPKSEKVFVPKKSSTPRSLSPNRSLSPILDNDNALNSKLCYLNDGDSESTGLTSKSANHRHHHHHHSQHNRFGTPTQMTTDNRKYTKKIDNEIVNLKRFEFDINNIGGGGSGGSAPIILHSTLKNADLEMVGECNENDKPQMSEEDARKEKLLRQRLQLLEEHNQLKQLIEQQERLLKEKNSQITLQQQLHRERLTQLIDASNQVRTPTMTPDSYMTPTSAQMPATSTLSYNTNQPQNYNNNLNGFDNFNNNRINELRQNDYNTEILNLNALINDLPQQRLQTTTYNNNNSNTNHFSKPSKTSHKIKQENNFIFDLVAENPNRGGTYTYNSQQLFTSNTTYEEDDSKLIEEIFFIN